MLRIVLNGYFFGFAKKAQVAKTKQKKMLQHSDMVLILIEVVVRAKRSWAPMLWPVALRMAISFRRRADIAK